MQIGPQEIQPQPPSPNLYQLEHIFMQGAETQRKANEYLQQAKPTKYAKIQTIHVLSFCGFKLNEPHLLTEVWNMLKKGLVRSMVELTKWFKKVKDDDDMDVVFHKDLVKDIEKLRFYYGATPTTDTAH